MKVFLGYFDIMGFKNYMLNTPLDKATEKFNRLFLDSQLAITGDKIFQSGGSAMPEINLQGVEALHISDSIIFWTKDVSHDGFKRIVDACYTFAWRSGYTFPARGGIVYGDIHFQPFEIKGMTGVSFRNSSIIGKGLVDAYSLADSLNFAGCVLSSTALEQGDDRLISELIYEQKLVYYKVPFKTGDAYAYVLRPLKNTHNEVSFKNEALKVERVFSGQSPNGVLDLSTTLKMNNTIDFHRSFILLNDLPKEEV